MGSCQKHWPMNSGSFWVWALAHWNSSWRLKLISDLQQCTPVHQWTELTTPLRSICGTLGKSNFCCSSLMPRAFWSSVNECSSSACNVLASCKCLSVIADFSTILLLTSLPRLSCPVHTSNRLVILCEIIFQSSKDNSITSLVHKIKQHIGLTDLKCKDKETAGAIFSLLAQHQQLNASSNHEALVSNHGN